MEHRGRYAGWGALFFATGAVIGAGTALLFAPYSGRKTRREIGRYVRKTRGMAEGMAEEFAGTVRDLADTVGDRASGILEAGKDMTREAKHKVIKAVEDAADRLGHEKERLLKLAS